MNVPLARAVVLVVGLTCSLRGAEDTPKSSTKDLLKARIAEDAKKVDPAKAASTLPPAKPVTATPASETAKQDQVPAKPAASAAMETPTVLPKVEVKKGRITELDQKLAKQEKDIARERKNLKSSEVDAALNDGKIAKPLAIFGGESAQFRQRVASERVELMEAEKDILEAMAQAKTKEEKKELQKQLDEIKAFRRDLEKSLR